MIRAFVLFFIVAGVFYPLPCESGTSTGLLNWWQFDDGSGTTATDSSPDFGQTANNGTLHGGISWVTGRKGKAIQNSSTSGTDYVNFSPVTGPNSNTTFTITAWVFMTGASFGNAGYGAILTDYTDGDGFNVVQGGSAYNLDFYNFDASEFDSPAIMTSGKWYHIAITSNSGAPVFYINGAPVAASGTVTVKTGINFSSTAADSFPDTFIGIIDDLRFYNRALSAAEIRKLYIGDDTMSYGSL